MIGSIYIKHQHPVRTEQSEISHDVTVTIESVIYPYRRAIEVIVKQR